MTAAHMGLVFAAEGLDGAEKLLLLAYCNRTDDHGYCWPGQKRLVDDCGTSAATVKRVKKSLIDKGLISSVRRVDPVTGDPITNLTRVNVRLLEQMARSKTAYDDNVIEQLTFAQGAPLPTKRKRAKRSSADVLRAHSEPGPDLLRAQDEPTLGSTWAHPLLKMSPPPAHLEPLTLIDPSENPQPTLHPSGEPMYAGSDGQDGRTDGSDRRGGGQGQGSSVAVGSDTARGNDEQPMQSSPGLDVLNAIAQECGPEFLLTGKTLADQAAVVNMLLGRNWSAAQIRHVVVGPGWPGVIKTSREALIAGRLRRAAEGPAPSSASPIPAPSAPVDAEPWVSEEVATWTPPAWTGDVQRVLAECAECGSPAIADGHDRCAACLGWPECAGSCGIAGTSKRRVRPEEPTGLCSTCREWHRSPTEGSEQVQRQMV
ncbi:helix-turn-helix domain-containing protein [Streptomyces sp. NPDC127084]|uniref:helix-turn-helix domain-containing protein n=1 Tax=Streptomyces sp. NPDC127084 TaxID=3347133 RepID=UPI003654DAF8